MAKLQIRGLHKRFGAVEVLRGIDLSIEDQEFCVLLGPSGCGKSTLLRLIAGLEELSEGELFLNGKEITDTPAAQRNLAMVFQSYALYPHMSVGENLGFALKLAKLPAAQRTAKVRRAAEILGLEALLERKPAALSGGQRQRVAIGRAIVREPQIFLFDEPLSNLDAALRAQTRVEIASLHRKLAATIIYVTHDQIEAMTLADKIVVFSAGRIEQVGSPLDLYRRPANRFVAGFVGIPQMNFLPGRLEHSGVLLDNGRQLAVPNERLAAAEGAAVTVGVRPEHVALHPPPNAAAALAVNGQLDLAERLGSDTYLHVTVPSLGVLLARVEGDFTAKPGAPIVLYLDPTRVHLFDDDGVAFSHPKLS